MNKNPFKQIENLEPDEDIKKRVFRNVKIIDFIQDTAELFSVKVSEAISKLFLAESEPDENNDKK